MNKNVENSYPTKNKKPLLVDRFSHTLENCLFAKQELIKYGFSEDDFYYADIDDTEVGLLLGEPIMKSNDDDCVTALHLYKQKCFSEEVDEDEMYNFFFDDDY